MKIKIHGIYRFHVTEKCKKEYPNKFDYAQVDKSIFIADPSAPIDSMDRLLKAGYIEIAEITDERKIEILMRVYKKYGRCMITHDFELKYNI
jgi:hypothetical protein